MGVWCVWWVGLWRQVEVQARRCQIIAHGPFGETTTRRARFSLSCHRAALLGRTGRFSMLWQLRRRDKDRLELAVLDSQSLCSVEATLIPSTHPPTPPTPPHDTPHRLSTDTPPHATAPETWVSRRKSCRQAPAQPRPKVRSKMSACIEGKERRRSRREAERLLRQRHCAWTRHP